MPPEPRYEEPFYWWGPGWEPPARFELVHLLRDGAIEPDAAALLWAGLVRHQSIVVIGGPGGIGKSTLLASLLELAPRSSRSIYLRGCYETFAFLDDASLDPEHTLLLANEISPHLPIYLWGPAVSRALDAVRQGFALLATAHASSVTEFVATLTGSPLRLAARSVALLDLVVLLEASAEHRSGRCVSGIWRLGEAAQGITVEQQWASGMSDISHGDSKPPTITNPPRAPSRELDVRTRLLIDLRTGICEQLPEEDDVRKLVEGSLRNDE